MGKKNVITPNSHFWKVHTVNLLTEIVEYNKGMGILKVPINIFRNILANVAERAIELDDPELNILMLRLHLYEVPPMEVENQIKLQQKRMKDV